jgi:hypothetical protein
MDDWSPETVPCPKKYPFWYIGKESFLILESESKTL